MDVRTSAPPRRAVLLEPCKGALDALGLGSGHATLYQVDVSIVADSLLRRPQDFNAHLHTSTDTRTHIWCIETLGAVLIQLLLTHMHAFLNL